VTDLIRVSLTVNGKTAAAEVEPRMLLSQFLREHLRLTGTHVGCDTAQCGACVVHVNGRAVKSCNMLAAQANGSQVLTIEGVAGPGGDLHPMQAAFKREHGLQCGFCTPGMVMTALALVGEDPAPSDETIRAGLSGNLCRCTGYHNIVRAVKAGAAAMKA
jgi:carbon-monoxide dehydrogenase small subunit